MAQHHVPAAAACPCHGVVSLGDPANDAAGANAASGYTGSSSWYNLANAINQNLLLSDSYTFSPTFTNEFRFSFGRLRADLIRG